MLVFYRMCGIASTNPSPIFQENKYNLNKLCLRSFVKAFKEVKPKVIFLNDHCGFEYKEMIDSIVPFEHEQHFSTMGINQTCLKQYELAFTAEEPILFQECDYLYRPDAGKLLLEGVEKLGLVSPYDHRNFYIDRSIHSNQTTIELVNEQHWRTTERNTMTFAIKPNIFKENYETFYKYGYLDNDVWHDMRNAGYPLWVPIPSLATHMVQDYMAPGVDWKKLWEI